MNAADLVEARIARIERVLGLSERSDAAPLVDDGQVALAHHIAKRVCFEMGLRVDAVLGGGRQRSLARARAAIVWLASRHGEYSDRQLGAMLGGRERTTMLHFRLRGETLRQRDPAFRMVTDRLLDELEGTRQ